MLDADIRARYDSWLTHVKDADLLTQLNAMQGDDALIEDAFYRDLSFGTGGLRGVIGAGANRMNVYTVGRASQGLANYVIKRFAPARRSVAISYDSRLQSDVFARTAAAVFAANGLRVHLYSQLMPTPCLSYAVRSLGCAAGVMVTASHNPSQYNGYKVYGSDGCQITTQAAAEILAEINGVDPFADIRWGDYEAAVQAGQIQPISDSVYDGFIAAVRSQSLLAPTDQADKSSTIVYTPLNGTGLRPVQRALHESGFEHVMVVEEQALPDGRFPTCPYPNPEIPEAMALGLRDAARYQADLLLATDPDCDRVGIAVKDGQGGYTLLSGNQTGVLLLDYVCARRLALGRMPRHPVAVKTIVTTDMATRIAAHYGVEMREVLTGFKFIGEQIGLLEAQGRADDYIFGFEESYGYLSGAYVRDKDAVNAALLICEMFAWYKAQGVSLLERLEALYRQYGYYQNTLLSYTFEGAAGFENMQAIMRALRSEGMRFGGLSVLERLDFLPGRDGLPPADVIKFQLAGHCAVVVRPSGTEPKLKAYISVCADDRAAAQAMTGRLSETLNDRMGAASAG